MARKRLLLLTPQLPWPPTQGTALRNWGLLCGLAERADLTLLSFAAPWQEPTVPAPIGGRVAHAEVLPQPHRSMGRRLRQLVSDARPDLALRLWSAPFARRLAALLEGGGFDWVQVEGLELGPYLEQVAAHPARPRILFDDHNCEYLLQKRAWEIDRRHPRRWKGALYSAVQWRKLARYEAHLMRLADLTVAVSQADAAALRRIAPEIEPLVLPNGLFVADYAAEGERAPLKTPAFVFTGTMDFRPNVDGVLWFADEVWPRIRAALPLAHFYVVGRRPHARLEPLRRRPGIVITGEVPDARAYIRAATVYVIPLRMGGGTRLKVLEAAASGIPIVSTRLGAEGFPEAEEALVLADEAERFAERAIALALDAEARRRWAERARLFARRYDWSRLLPPLYRRLGLD